ncbi:D-tyrosyl-tRNA(Tyr) deacylase [Bifidobacterium sp. 82T24]|uniref:D-aminoacyl-tRNA deacylase n=1 Tax=Bifidobacterium pluvialisilvae TaxID=2834436 RepID=UPI001C57CA4B|nr:D-aminoacyl-tRNA deacylase [Bifidobacterium pluvialisilvae]MBW3087779.1 D-tyrosyl-tRNA(Tyr) deacylase [Bifidobacterium pluvialisilvae]
MRIIVQKVSQASVDVVPESPQDEPFTPQSIGPGYMLLVGVADADGAEQVSWLARKIAHLRVFEDENGKMNRSLLDVGGEVLSISQFTLFADVRKGNRPGFTGAGKPDHAERIWHGFNEELASYGVVVREGRFGAHMQVSLTNDGPVTISYDTDVLMK